jgi:hypothetical protein
VRGMVANDLEFSLLISKPANNMSYDGKAMLSRPVADDISVGHVILARPAPADSNTHIESFAAHCEEFFADWNP